MIPIKTSPPVAYLAGPYRSGRGPEGVGHNVAAASKVAQEMWAMGFAVLCPHTNSGLFDYAAPGKDLEDQVWLNGYQAMLRRCDLIVMLDDWPYSEGAMAERRLAEELGLLIFSWEEPEDREQLVEIAVAAAGAVPRPAGVSPRSHLRTLMGTDIPSVIIRAGLAVGHIMSEAGDEQPLLVRKEKMRELGRICNSITDVAGNLAKLALFIGGERAEEQEEGTGDEH